MSYDIELTNPVTGDTLELDAPHHMRGGTYAVGGTTRAHLNVTYNYYPQFSRVFDVLAEPRQKAPEWLRKDGAPVSGVREAAGVYEVPCNGCTKCCRGDAVRLLPHEDTEKWRTEPHPYMAGALMLAHKQSGDCFYLGEHGCTIQSNKPQMCREMDCRRIAQAMTWTQARKLDKRGALRLDIWERGKELLRSNVEANRL